MAASRKDRRELARFLEALPGADGERFDLEGPAVYRLAPTPMTAILCRRCGFVALVLSIPRRRITHECSACGYATRLTPPLDVLAAANRPLEAPAARLS